MDYIPIPLDTIRAAYNEIGRLVYVDLRAQLGNRHQECLNLVNLVQQHCANIPLDEFKVIESSLHPMVTALDQALETSNNFSDAPPPQITQRIYAGQHGRPCIKIDPEILETALELRGGTLLLGQTLGLLSLDHPSTLITFNLMAQPLAFTDPRRVLHQKFDAELDLIIASILEAFPSFGRRMITGCLRFLGHQVPCWQIQQAYARVHGAPSSGFGVCRIERRICHVPGPNSLWHHDGQHGLIRWKIVFHGFIDGFSRMGTGMRASNNNRLETVLDVFENAIDEHGLPSRICGNHGTENILVCAFMEAARGLIGGPIFLAGPINQDVMEWAQAWNDHTIAQHLECGTSPRNMFFFGMLTHGVCGDYPQECDEQVNDIDAYGIDWDDFDQPKILNHHNIANPIPSGIDPNPFLTQIPMHLNHVEVKEPTAPITQDQLANL